MPFSAAPNGAWPSLQGGRYYKHGAPNGAEPVSVAEDTYILRRRPEPASDLAGSHGSLVPIAI